MGSAELGAHHVVQTKADGSHRQDRDLTGGMGAEVVVHLEEGTLVGRAILVP